MKKGKKIFQFVHETVTALAQTDGLSMVAFNLFLQAAQAASSCDYETIAYEFMSQAFTIYEEEIDGSRDQYNAIRLLIGPLPAALLAVGLWFCYRYPISRDRHQQILLALDEKRQQRLDDNEAIEAGSSPPGP